MKHNKNLVIAFFAILFGIMLLYPVNYLLVKKGIMFINVDNYAKPNYKENGLFINIENKLERYKTAINNRVVNYFPFYSIINIIDKSINSYMNSNLYNLLNISYYPTGKNIDNEFILRDNDHYILQNQMTKEELDKRLDKQITFFNNLDIDNLYLFLPDRFEYSNIDNSIFLKNMSDYVDKFKNKLNSNIKYSEFKVDSKEEYLKYFYKTDHHYNMYGAYESYKIIMNMLNKDIKNVEIKALDNIKYYGSIAKSSYLTDIYDNFYVMNVDLAEHKVLVNDEINYNYKPKKINISNNIFNDYYVNYFNGMFGKVEYDFNNNKSNLLIISDSYSWQIDELIASSYNKTFVINIRYLDDAFNIKEFIKENSIEDTLFLYETSTILFDVYDYNISKKVK